MVVAVLRMLTPSASAMTTRRHAREPSLEISPSSQLDLADFEQRLQDSPNFRQRVFFELDLDRDGKLDVEPFERASALERRRRACQAVSWEAAAEKIEISDFSLKTKLGGGGGQIYLGTLGDCKVALKKFYKKGMEFSQYKQDGEHEATMAKAAADVIEAHKGDRKGDGAATECTLTHGAPHVLASGWGKDVTPDGKVTPTVESENAFYFIVYTQAAGKELGGTKGWAHGVDDATKAEYAPLLEQCLQHLTFVLHSVGKMAHGDFHSGNALFDVESETLFMIDFGESQFFARPTEAVLKKAPSLKSNPINADEMDPVEIDNKAWMWEDIIASANAGPGGSSGLFDGEDVVLPGSEPPLVIPAVGSEEEEDEEEDDW